MTTKKQTKRNKEHIKDLNEGLKKISDNLSKVVFLAIDIGDYLVTKDAHGELTGIYLVKEILYSKGVQYLTLAHLDIRRNVFYSTITYDNLGQFSLADTAEQEMFQAIVNFKEHGRNGFKLELGDIIDLNGEERITITTNRLLESYSLTRWLLDDAKLITTARELAEKLKPEARSAWLQENSYLLNKSK